VRAGTSTASDPLTSELHRSVDAIAEDWDELAERVACTPFARPGWFQAFLAAFPSPRALIIAVRRGETLVAVMPLSEHRGARGSLTNLHSPRFEPLAEDAEAAEALARAALSARRLSLSFVELGSDTMSAFTGVAKEAGYTLDTRDAEASPEVEISGTWEEYLPTISKNMRREFKRRQKRLDEAGEFRFEVHDSAADIEARVREAFAVEAASWKGSTGTAVALEQGLLDFYLRVAAWAAPRGWLRVCLMRLDGTAIASDFALEVEGIFYSLKGGYDPAYAEYSPGRLMDGLEIQRAHELGLRRFEFGGDPEHHKLQWRPELRQLTNVEAFAPTLAGRAERLVRVQGRGAAKTLRLRARALLRR